MKKMIESKNLKKWLNKNTKYFAGEYYIFKDDLLQKIKELEKEKKK